MIVNRTIPIVLFFYATQVTIGLRATGEAKTKSLPQLPGSWKSTTRVQTNWCNDMVTNWARWWFMIDKKSKDAKDWTRETRDTDKRHMVPCRHCRETEIAEQGRYDNKHIPKTNRDLKKVRGYFVVCPHIFRSLQLLPYASPCFWLEHWVGKENMK